MFCQFCHKNIPGFLYSFHIKAHLRRKANGQQNDHITMPKSARYQGSLDGVPRVYLHPKCGKCTGMPEDIIRSYLVNPFMYNDRTFCTGCQDYVSTEELFWVETNQRMSEYNEQLRAAARARKMGL